MGAGQDLLIPGLNRPAGQRSRSCFNPESRTELGIVLRLRWACLNWQTSFLFPMLHPSHPIPSLSDSAPFQTDQVAYKKKCMKSKSSINSSIHQGATVTH